MPQGSEQADAVAARLRDILAAAEGEVRRLLLKMQTTPGEATLAATQNNQAVVSQIRRRIASLGGLITEEAAKASAAAATGESRRLGITMEPDVLRVLDAITEDRIREISATWAAAADEVARAARVATTSGADLSRLIDDVQGKLGGARASSLSAVDSMTMAAGRQITILDAEMGGEDMVYAYGGPVDAITRLFCRNHHSRLTSQVYTVEALDRLSNPGQPTPVSVYLGGFNCRHNLQPMTRAMALDRGYRVVE